MRPGRIVLVGVCVLMGFAQLGPANAADIPLKAPPPVYSPWAGFYVGGHGGYGWDPARGDFDPVAYGTTVVPGLLVQIGTAPNHLSVNPSGWYGGFQAGYNWQNRNWVWGLEGDISFGRIKDQAVQQFAAAGFTPQESVVGYTGNVRLSQEANYFGTVRGRIGWAFNTLLLFGTGGFAWGHVKTSFDVFNVTAVGTASPAVLGALAAGASASSSKIQTGYAVGGGAEWALTRQWRLKAEYLYINLGDSPALIIPGGVATGSFAIQTVRLGLNFQF